MGLQQNVENLDVTQGKFQGKMIVVQSLMDGDALPWMAAWYQTKVRDVLGASIDDNYRLWYNDNAQHVAPTTALQMTHVISYQGILEQALRDLSAWVEKGVAPPASTSFTVKEGQVHARPAPRRARAFSPSSI